MRNYYESNPEGILFLYFFAVQSVLFLGDEPVATLPSLYQCYDEDCAARNLCIKIENCLFHGNFAVNQNILKDNLNIF